MMKRFMYRYHDASSFIVMSLTPPKRLFHVPSMSTVMYVDVAEDVSEKGYSAISHVWGEQKLYTAKQLGITAGIKWIIPLSNREKMTRLKSAMEYHKMEYCWFDVLCMPQDKQDEINKEIPFMGDYYAEARMTLVLSTVDYNMSDDFAKLCILMDKCENEKRNFNLDEDKWVMSHKFGMVDFSKEQWFERVWTLQETVLSKNVIFILKNGLFLNLSDLLIRTAKLKTMSEVYVYNLFFESSYLMANLCKVVNYDRTKTDIKFAMSMIIGRKCKKLQDKYYGVFGILDYKNFVVDYNMEVDELAKKIVQYAYSKGDVSWMAVGGYFWPGFVQPMYSNIHVGNLWKKSEECEITFLDNKISLNVTKVATIVECKDPKKFQVGAQKFLKWTYDIFIKWGFDEIDAMFAVSQYHKLPSPFAKYMTEYFYAEEADFGEIFEADMQKIIKNTNPENCMNALLQYKHNSIKALNILSNVIQDNTNILRWVNVVKAIDEIGGKIALIVSGSVAVGDLVLLTKMRDDDGRILGIITYGNIRKGVCAFPDMNISKYTYFTHKFMM
jgi:hypothetical protein